jgi:hypothetical protein
MEITYHEQIVLTILDKALIGGILAIAGFWANRYLEAFKSRRELENELSKLRDQKHLEIVESQLSKFYWPLYLRLQMDNVVWRRILDRTAEDEVKRAVAGQIDANFLLPNHEAICMTIQSNIHLASADATLFDALLRYLRHVAVYKALRASGIHNMDPIALGEGWPKDLFPKIEEATLAKQREFEQMLKERAETAARK